MESNIIASLEPLIADIDSVHLDPKNARTHPDRNLEAIKNSLTIYGQRKPIVCNRDTGHIEAGNGLWQAAKELGWDKIAAAFVDDDADLAKGYGLMDNKSALLADWDFPNLKDLLEELDTGAVDMEQLTGFSNDEIEELMTQTFEPKEGNTENDTQIICPKCGHIFTERPYNDSRKTKETNSS